MPARPGIVALVDGIIDSRLDRVKVCLNTSRRWRSAWAHSIPVVVVMLCILQLLKLVVVGQARLGIQTEILDIVDILAAALVTELEVLLLRPDQKSVVCLGTKNVPLGRWIVADKAVVANGMRIDHDVAVNKLRHVGRLEGSRVLLCAVCCV